jgi:hypothetical protein
MLGSEHPRTLEALQSIVDCSTGTAPAASAAGASADGGSDGGKGRGGKARAVPVFERGDDTWDVTETTQTTTSTTGRKKGGNKRR